MKKNVYEDFKTLSDNLYSKFSKKYGRLPDRTYMPFAMIRPYVPVWNMMNKLPVPYSNIQNATLYLNTLNSHPDSWICPWLNSIDMPKDQLSVSQLYMLFENSRHTYKDLNITAKSHVTLELVNTIKSSTSNFDRLFAIKLFSKNISEFCTDQKIIKLVDRNLRSLKMPLETLSRFGREIYAERLIDKFIEDKELKAALNVHLSFEGVEIKDMSFDTLINFIHQQKIALKIKEEALPELLLEDFTF